MHRAFECIQLSEPESGVVTLTLNRRDKKNALSIAPRDEVSAALAGLAADDSVSAVIVTGAGNVFSAGFDPKEFARINDPACAEQLWASPDRLRRAALGFQTALHL